MASIEVKTNINAPPSAVYQVLMDFSAYKEWNPMVVQISGTPSVGETIEADVKIGTRAPMAFKPTILVNDINKELRWVGVFLAALVCRGEHYFSIEETETGCVFTHGEDWSGILGPFVTRILGKETLEASYKGMNDALKARVEAEAHEQN